MNNICQFLLNSKNALTVYDNADRENYVNTDSFGASDKFNDLWNSAHEELVDKYNLPAFHLWETGFVKGDASDDEVFEAKDKINEVEGATTVYCKYTDDDELDTDVYDFLDKKLLEILEPKVSVLIDEYNAFCKSELEDTKS